MHAFEPAPNLAVCQFEDPEVGVLSSLLHQLIELIADADPSGPNGPGTRLDLNATDDDIFSRLEREMEESANVCEPMFEADPVIKRLFPDAYPDDDRASYEFRRYTQTDLMDDKIACARTMLTDLDTVDGSGRCAVPLPHVNAWLKSLTNLRLALAVRLDIEDAEDAEALAEIDDSDPKVWVASIYEWLGWVQESLLAALA